MKKAEIKFEKAFVRVDTNLLLQVLEEQVYPQLIRTIQGLYNGSNIGGSGSH